jgi:hypothetical protein
MIQILFTWTKLNYKSTIFSSTCREHKNYDAIILGTISLDNGYLDNFDNEFLNKYKIFLWNVLILLN